MVHLKWRLADLIVSLLLLLMFNGDDGSFGVEAKANPLDLPDVFAKKCISSLPSDARVDAIVYYEKAKSIGIFYNEFYWEMKFVHNEQFPLITKRPVLVKEFWRDTRPNCRDTVTCLDPKGNKPWIESVYYFKGEVFILYPPETAATSKRWIYKYAYDPTTTSATPRFIDIVTPESVLPQFGRDVFLVPSLTAIFVTHDPSSPSRRIIWTNKKQERKSLEAWKESQLATGAFPQHTFNLVDPETKLASPDLIWALDTYSMDTSDPERVTSLILNFRRYLYYDFGESFSYALSFSLNQGTDGWEFRRVKHKLWEIGIFLGCPQALCFDTTLDGAVGASGGANSFQTFLFRGPYIYKSVHPMAFQIKYPNASYTATGDNDVRSIQDVVANKEDYIRDGTTTFDALMSIPSTAGDYQSVYLIKGEMWFMYEVAGLNDFGRDLKATGRVSQLFSDLSLETGKDGNLIDAVWYNGAEQKAYIYGGSYSWACTLTRNPERGKAHVFTQCASMQTEKPVGWKTSIDAILTYPGQTKVAFLSGSLYWFVENDANWAKRNYRPRLVHPITKGSGKSLFVDTAHLCNYEKSFTKPLDTQKVWQFLLNFNSDEATEVIKPIQPSKGQSDGDGDSIQTTTWVGLLLIVLLLFFTLVLYYGFRKQFVRPPDRKSLRRRGSVRSRTGSTTGSTTGSGIMPRIGSNVSNQSSTGSSVGFERHGSIASAAKSVMLK